MLLSAEIGVPVRDGMVGKADSLFGKQETKCFSVKILL